jgi:hypothetical protein
MWFEHHVVCGIQDVCSTPPNNDADNIEPFFDDLDAQTSITCAQLKRRCRASAIHNRRALNRQDQERIVELLSGTRKFG